MQYLLDTNICIALIKNIGAVAKQSNITLVTHNTKYFSHIPGLVLEDWIAE